MKKTLLALAVAALSANAFAVNLDAPANTTQKYANEHIIPAAGLTLTGAQVLVNAGVSVTTQSYIRFDLNNGATFDNSALVPVNAALTSANANWILSAGGAGQSFAIYRPDANIDLTEQLTLLPLVKVVNKNAVGVTFNVYEDLFDAQNQQRSVYNKAGTYLTFADALVVNAVDSDNTKIAINNAAGTRNFTEFKKAAPLVTTALTNLSVSTAADVLLATGVAATPAGLISAGTWTLEGNLVAAAANATGLSIAAAPAATNMGALTMVTARNKATVAIVPAAAASTATIDYTVTGDIAVPDTNVNATFAPVAQAGFQIAPKEVLNAGVIRRDGSSQEVDLVLNPNSPYKNFIRITNKAGIAGKIVIDVINDEGTARTVSLSEVAGQTADSLNAGASSTQINVVDIFNAAQAKGLTLTGNGKLRYVVTGEVPSTEYGVANTAGATDTIIPTNDGISVQSYTVSQDGNSFSAWKF